MQSVSGYRCTSPRYLGGISPVTTFERELERVSTFYWGDKTSNIVALFKDEDETIRCFESAGLKPCDPRWLLKTREVLKEIGDDHPSFYVAEMPDLALLPRVRAA